MIILTSILLSFMLIFSQISVPVEIIKLANTDSYSFTTEYTGEISEDHFSFKASGDIFKGKEIKDYYLNTNFELNVPDETNISGDLLIKDGKVFVTGKTLISIFENDYKFNNNTFGIDLLKEDTYNAILSALKYKYMDSYIELESIEEVENEYNVSQEEVENIINSQKKTTKLIESLFKDFKPNTSFLKSDDKNFEFRIDPDIIYNFSVEVADFMYENKEKIYSIIETSLEEINEADTEFFNNFEITYEEVKNSLEESKEDIFYGIDEFYKVAHETGEESLKASLDIFKNSKFENTMRLEDNSLVITTNLLLNVDNELLTDIKGNIKITENKNINKVSISNIAKIEDYEKTIEDIKREKQPFNHITIDWVDNSSYYDDPYYNKANISMYEYRLDDPEKNISVYGLSHNSREDYHIIEDRIYLPLRSICEDMGLTVEWDAINNKAYIIKGNEKIDMTGKIINDRTFIKIRDFEKLGFVVNYEQSQHPYGTFSTATLSTPEYVEYFNN